MASTRVSGVQSPYAPRGPGGVNPVYASPVLQRSQSEVMYRPASEEMQGWASNTQFTTTYQDMIKRSEGWMRRSASDFGTHTRGKEDPRWTRMGNDQTGKHRAAGVDYVLKAEDEFPPLADSSGKKNGTFKRWTNFRHTCSPNFNYGNWDHKEPLMDKKGQYVPYTPYNQDRAANDSRPNCFEFKAGYRHSDYPLTKMSTSITTLPASKKYYSNVHPKEIPNGREWQWTFRSQDANVGRLSCSLYRDMPM